MIFGYGDDVSPFSGFEMKPYFRHTLLLSTCSRDMLSCSAASKEGDTSCMGERVASPPRGAETAPRAGGPPPPLPPPRPSPLPWRYTENSVCPSAELFKV